MAHRDPGPQARQAARRARVVMALPDAAGPGPVTVRPQDAPRHAAQVVRRVLLRRNIVIDAETAQLVAAVVRAALQVSAPPRAPRRGPRVPAADCEPASLT